jgi:hypothetical protein
MRLVWIASLPGETLGKTMSKMCEIVRLRPRGDRPEMQSIFSSARTMKRFPLRCASATNILRPSRSTVATQPKLLPLCSDYQRCFPKASPLRSRLGFSRLSPCRVHGLFLRCHDCPGRFLRANPCEFPRLQTSHLGRNLCHAQEQHSIRWGDGRT